MKNLDQLLRYILICILSILLLIALSIECIAPFCEDIVQVKVNEKAVSIRSDESVYLIMTDREVFENTDDLLIAKFNSSDVYASIKVGKKYKMVVYGFRIPFLSMYRNIRSVDEVSSYD